MVGNIGKLKVPYTSATAIIKIFFIINRCALFVAFSVPGRNVVLLGGRYKLSVIDMNWGIKVELCGLWRSDGRRWHYHSVNIVIIAPATIQHKNT